MSMENINIRDSPIIGRNVAVKSYNSKQGRSDVVMELGSLLITPGRERNPLKRSNMANTVFKKINKKNYNPELLGKSVFNMNLEKLSQMRKLGNKVPGMIIKK